jgi:hypothetical protein
LHIGSASSERSCGIADFLEKRGRNQRREPDFTLAFDGQAATFAIVRKRSVQRQEREMNQTTKISKPAKQFTAADTIRVLRERDEAEKVAKPKAKGKGSAVVRAERISQKPAPLLPVNTDRAVEVLEQKGEVPMLSTDPKVLASLKPYQPSPAAIAEAMIPDKAKPAAKPQAKRSPPPNTRYEGSQTQRWDQALVAGGSYEEIGKQVGKPASLIRAHAKFRVKSGKWLLTENGDTVKLVPVVAASK